MSSKGETETLQYFAVWESTKKIISKYQHYYSEIQIINENVNVIDDFRGFYSIMLFN